MWSSRVLSSPKWFSVKRCFHAIGNAPPAARHVRTLTKDDRRSFLDSFDMVFCDCDGVIWQTLGDIIPGSPDAINYLRSMGKQVRFVTNNSIVTTGQHVEKFKRYGIKVEQGHIIQPATSVCEYLKSINFNGLIYPITTSPFKQMLRSEGFQLVDEPATGNTESLDALREAIYKREPVKAIIIDVDFNLTAAKLMRAHVQLTNDPECLLIGGAADTVIPFGGGDIIGPGPFIEVVEKTSRRKAIVLGKPGQELCNKLLREFAPTEPRRALFIGDSLATDIRFGRMCGFQTLLVLSGHTRPQDLTDRPVAGEETPDYVADSLKDLHALLR